MNVITQKLPSLIAFLILLSVCTTLQSQESRSLSDRIYPTNDRSPRDLEMFSLDSQQCYDRNTQLYTSVVDAHNHFRPFGGPAIPMYELDDYFRRTGVLFVNVFGIGQTLPTDSSCTYYLDCPGTKVEPGIKSDFRNASNYLEYIPEGIHLTLSMSFPDLANPQDIKRQMQQLDAKYPNLFSWMGEVNLVKQAIFRNGHEATPIDKIAEWAGFMEMLREKNMPITIHSDLGNDDEPTKYLGLMEKVLELYPDNKIVWAHMGLSNELKHIDPSKHIAIVKLLLDKHPNLMVDISWRVIYENYFEQSDSRKMYVDFLNQYSDRILPGTDFVASRDKDFLVYAEEVEVTSRINMYLDNKAFRNIALGENYFRLLNLGYRAPDICEG